MVKNEFPNSTKSDTRNFFIVLVIVVSILLLTPVSITFYANSSSQNTPAAASSNTTFSVGWGYSTITDVNPYNNPGLAQSWIFSYIYDTLAKFSANQTQLLPDLAQSWNIYPNNHTAIFHLNPAAKWSDGQPVTSQDVNYSYYLAAQPFSFIYPYVSMITSIDTPDNYTVVFHYTGVLFEEVAITNIFIVPYHIWKNVNPATYGVFSNATTFVGSGPFLLTNYVPNSYVKLVRNPNYFIPSRIPHIETLYMQLFSSVQAEVSAYQSGEIDATGGFLLPTEVNQFKNSTNSILIIPKNPIYMYYLAFNTNPNGTGNPALLNTDFREGLAHAIDYNALINITQGGNAENMQTMFPSWDPSLDPNLGPISYNVTLANQLLNASGFQIGSNGYRQFPNGTTIKLTLLAVTGIPALVSAANVIATNYWSAVHVEATAQPIEVASMINDIWPNFQQDIDFWDWPMGLAPYDLSSPLFLGLFISSQVPTFDDSGYSNSTYDALYNQMVNASTFAEMTNISYELQKSLYYQLPYLPLYYPYSSQVYSNKWTNISTDYPGGPFGGVDWRTFLTIEPVNSTTSHPQSNNTLLYAGVAVVVVLAAVAGGLYYNKRRKKN